MIKTIVLALFAVFTANAFGQTTANIRNPSRGPECVVEWNVDQFGRPTTIASEFRCEHSAGGAPSTTWSRQGGVVQNNIILVPQGQSLPAGCSSLSIGAGLPASIDGRNFAVPIGFRTAWCGSQRSEGRAEPSSSERRETREAAEQKGGVCWVKVDGVRKDYIAYNGSPFTQSSCVDWRARLTAASEKKDGQEIRQMFSDSTPK